MFGKKGLEGIKAPVVLLASPEAGYTDICARAEDGKLALYAYEICKKSGRRRAVRSSTKDLKEYTQPEEISGETEAFQRFQALLKEKEEQNADRDACIVHDTVSGYFLKFYRTQEKQPDMEAGSIGVAVSRDKTYWMYFERDHATYPNHGIVYDGDYYKAIPYGEYLFREEIPRGSSVFDIREFGAVADGVTLCTEAINAAARAAWAAGGGTVLVEGGYYCSATVRLYDNTTLFIAADSALYASKDLSRYGDAFVEAVDAKNISVRGGGKIIGNGEYFTYLPLKRPLLHPLEETKLPPVLYDPMGYPVDTIRYAYRSRIRYAEDRYAEGLPGIARPSYTVWIRNCENVQIENIIVEDAFSWTLNLDYSAHVTVRNMVINGNRHVANTDGIDIMCSRHVTVSHCFISCADDGICVKAPREQGHDGGCIADVGARMGPSYDIHISDCTVITVMNAFKIGTETYFDIGNVTVENCRFMLPDIYPGSVSGISIESADGSHVRNVTVRNIEMDKVCCPIFVCLNMRNKFGFEDEKSEKERRYGGSIENVTIENITAADVEVPSILTGFCKEEGGEIIERCIEKITVRNFRAVYRDNRENLTIADHVHESITDYPENNSFGDVPAYGFYIRHAKEAVLEDVEITPRTMNTRPCIVREKERQGV